jgi:hypothetical protein
MSDEQLEALASETLETLLERQNFNSDDTDYLRRLLLNALRRAAGGTWVSVGRKPPEGDYLTCEHRPDEGGTRWEIGLFYNGQWLSGEYGTVIHPTHYTPLTKPHSLKSDCIPR